MVLRRCRSVILDHEQGGGVFLHIDQEVLDVIEEELNALLAEGRVRQHPAQLDEQPQEVDGSVNVAGRSVRMLFADVSKLLSLKFVQQLRSQHDIEILPHPHGDFQDRLLPVRLATRAGLVARFVLDVVFDDLIHRDSGREGHQFPLPGEIVPIVDQVRFQLIWNIDPHLDLGEELLLSLDSVVRLLYDGRDRRLLLLLLLLG